MICVPLQVIYGRNPEGTLPLQSVPWAAWLGMLGGSIIATFDGTALDARGTYLTLIRDSGKDVAKATIELARLR